MILNLRRFSARRETPRVIYSHNAATLREKSHREEFLHTLLLEAEHIVYSRLLTEMDIEPTEAEGPMPNHFLIGRSCGAAAAGHFDDNVILGPPN
ncbi:hypothetical protein EVAR_83931_1 [Eumeta japonica]|uniref:Uncharacterized protein n=1 Tax=Eumeta variegata TaxID=151549 RepID=A0A4C1XQL2_EUMVA|nr:hypothetical protein EVAR_83931_1 [Eumeta japonica]